LKTIGIRCRTFNGLRHIMLWERPDDNLPEANFSQNKYFD